MSIERDYAQLRDDTLLVQVIYNDPMLYLHRATAERLEFAPKSGNNSNAYTLKRYTYKATRAQNVAPGDVVIVTVNNGELKFATVIETDSIENLGNSKTKWIVGKLDLSGITQIVNQEDEYRRLLTTAKAQQRRIEAVKRVMTGIDNKIGLEQLTQLDGMRNLGLVLESPSEKDSGSTAAGSAAG